MEKKERQVNLSFSFIIITSGQFHQKKMRSLPAHFFYFIYLDKSFSMTLDSFLQSDKSKKPHLLLLGHPVGHSLSPLMHQTAAAHYGMDLTYTAVDVKPGDLSSLAGLFNRETFKGANVTIPYKTQLFEFVDELDEAAREIGAINNIVPQAGRLWGYNTDAAGFLKQLEEFEEQLEGGRAIIFGTGGAARAVVHALRSLQLEELVLISRRPGRAEPWLQGDDIRLAGYGEWTAWAEEAMLIVNTTPLGMEPDVDSCPIREDEKEWLADRICYDIVYKPQRTKFLQLAEEAGGETLGGLDMLINQGSRSFELWTGKPFPIDKVKQAIYDKLNE